MPTAPAFWPRVTAAGPATTSAPTLSSPTRTSPPPPSPPFSPPSQPPPPPPPSLLPLTGTGAALGPGEGPTQAITGNEKGGGGLGRSQQRFHQQRATMQLRRKLVVSQRVVECSSTRCQKQRQQQSQQLRPRQQQHQQGCPPLVLDARAASAGVNGTGTSAEAAAAAAAATAGGGGLNRRCARKGWVGKALSVPKYHPRNHLHDYDPKDLQAKAVNDGRRALRRNFCSLTEGQKRLCRQQQ